MPDAVTKTLVIPSTLAAAHEAKETVMRQIRESGFPEEPGFAVRLALDEALSNAVRHGNKLDSEKKVVLSYTGSAREVTITVEDEGEGFDPYAVPDPTLDENLEHPHGRGLMLMRAYMTFVDYNERGNRVTMSKSHDCTLPRK